MPLRRALPIVLIGLLLFSSTGGALAQDPGPAQPGGGQVPLGTGFTYQGRLESGGNPHTGACGFEFGLWDDIGGGAQSGITQTVSAVAVADGYFSAQLNGGAEFGPSAFQGNARWLAIRVRCPDSGGYTALSPRQALTAAPYALFATGNWGLNGNYGTTAANFLGTTDNMTLTFMVNGATAFRLSPHATSPNVIGGHISNTVGVGIFGATISGGGSSGGGANTVYSSYATVGGGQANSAYGLWAAVGGGQANTASDQWAAVAGGSFNTASNWVAFVGGGVSNLASGYAATVPGGDRNTASGDYSFAAGRNARAIHQGAFVWADSNSGIITSTTTNQFLVRASGGITVYTNSAANAGVRVFPGGGSWTSVSDRNAKANFAPVDGVAILNTLAGIPIETWNYSAQDASIRHIGPMAQDFYAAFGVGETETGISTVDADGVALAAIQGLYTVVQEKESLLTEQRAALDAQQAALAEQSARIAALSERVAALESMGETEGPVTNTVQLALVLGAGLLAGAGIGAGALALGTQWRAFALGRVQRR